MEKDLLSPMATRKTRKMLRKRLEEQKADTCSRKERDRIHNQIIELEEAHPTINSEEPK